MLDKELTVEDVASRIKADYPNDCNLVFSDNNADEQVIRIRTIKPDKGGDDESKVEDDVMLKQFETHLLDTLTLRGVLGIERAFLNKETKLIETDDGALLAAKADDRCQEWYLDTS
ncbi:hypothetical protein BN1708_018138, partial [Verticillium longisporum]